MARDLPARDDPLQERILSTSGTLVGVCATLIGLVKVVEHRQGLSHVDEYAGCVGVVFVFCALLAYLALRTTRRGKAHLIVGTLADLLFLAGLIGLAGVSVMFAYDLI